MNTQRPTSEITADPFAVEAEMAAAVARVLATRSYETFLESGALTREFAEFCGSRYAVAVANRTDAMRMALTTVDVRPHDEVITVSYGPTSTATAIVQLGAIPRLIDIDPNTGMMDPTLVAAAINDRTRAVVVIHRGASADVDPIFETALENGLIVIEEGSNAVGATYDGDRVGALCDLAVVGFDPAAQLYASGQGGIVLTDSGELYEHLSLLASRTDHTTPVNRELGWDSRLDELQAAMLRVKLRHLAADLAADETIDHNLRPLVPIHRQPAFADRCIAMNLPNTDALSPSFVQL